MAINKKEPVQDDPVVATTNKKEPVRDDPVVATTKKKGAVAFYRKRAAR